MCLGGCAALHESQLVDTVSIQHLFSAFLTCIFGQRHLVDDKAQLGNRSVGVIVSFPLERAEGVDGCIPLLEQQAGAVAAPVSGFTSQSDGDDHDTSDVGTIAVFHQGADCMIVKSAQDEAGFQFNAFGVAIAQITGQLEADPAVL